MRTARSLIVATIVAATIAAPLGGIARAEAPGVAVALRVRIGYGPTLVHTTNECKVKVSRGANGIAVLKAARRAGCIESYDLSRDQGGTRTRCINGVCQMFWLATWSLYYDGPGPYGRLEGFRAVTAKTLEFDYAACLGGC